MKRASMSDLLKLKQALQTPKEVAATATKQVTDESKPPQVKIVHDETEVILAKAANKEKLTVNEQIKYLKIKGITFSSIDEVRAKEFLSNNTYYYKLTSYRKNFEPSSDKKFSNIDFAILNDLAVIDMHLRYLLFKLSLDIEHTLKSLLISLITSSDEDGYTIVDEFDNFEYQKYAQRIDRNSRITDKDAAKADYTSIQKKILRECYDKNDYNYDLLGKRKSKPSIWVLIEMMSYGELVKFINFYCKENKFGSSQLNIANQYLIMSKRIRDASAHSRPIIINIVNNSNSYKLKMSVHFKNYLIGKGIPATNIHNYMTNLKLHDLGTLFFLHDHYIKSPRMREERKKEMKSLLKRVIYKGKQYPPESELGNIFKLFARLVFNY